MPSCPSSAPPSWSSLSLTTGAAAPESQTLCWVLHSSILPPFFNDPPPAKVILQINNPSDRMHTSQRLPITPPLSILDPLRFAQDFNFRCQIEFCQDMICIRICFRAQHSDCVCERVPCKEYSYHKLMRWDKKHISWSLLSVNGILIRKPHTSSDFIISIHALGPERETKRNGRS